MATKRNNHRYTQLRDALRKRAQANSSPCHLCQGDKGPIRYDVPYTDPLAFTADHVLAVAGEGKGRMLGELRPAH